MFKAFFFVTVLSLSAFAADQTCKFQMEDSGEVFAAGTLTAKDKSEGKWELSVKYTAPEQSEENLGEATEKEIAEKDMSDIQDICTVLEERVEEKFCDKVTNASLITTPDVGGDSNDSFIGFLKDKDKKELARFFKIGWLVGGCLPEDKQ